ncbi:MAG: hypothetical protein QOJ58_1313 [Alphaproteobacteria bacterium]|nr:hypothetical protein [Alphaproteobacteria bacterium]
MDLNNDAASGGSEKSPIAQSRIVVVPAPAGDSPMDARAAARSLAAWRRDRDQQPNTSNDQPQLSARAERAAPHESAQESSPAQAGSDAGERPAPPGETESADPAAESRPEAGTDLPPIEAPRSWTKEDKDLFASLPRATQERIAERERSREGDFNRRQQEAAEKSKALEAERSKAEQARQQYEAALPQLLQTLQQQQAGEFADIKTLADAERLAREDAPRYALWDAQQKRIADIAQQLMLAQQRQAQERVQQFSEFARREDDLFKEKVPDMADAKKTSALQTACLAVLKELGFQEAELAQSWHGQRDLSLRDHRVQLLIRDATLWREAQAKAKAAATRPVPPVQRPGVSQPKGAAQDAEIQHLTQKLEKSGNLKDAAALLKARRAGTR